jgi:glycerophosphoryl diester phosphodiesterase
VGGKPLAIAHRGDWRDAPENTLAAFAAAARAGADMVEIDIRLTADGRVAVAHDPTLERVWGDPRPVAELTFAEVRAVTSDGLPELSDVLVAIDAPLMVDFTLEDVVEPALAAIEAAAALDRVLFSGDNVAGHRSIRERAPSARIALTWTDEAAPSDSLLDDLGVEFFNPPWQRVRADVVAAMHERGTAVSAWTVDDVQTMAQLLELGVDAVITNSIEPLVALVGETEGAEEARC